MSPLLFSICSLVTFLLANSPLVAAAANDTANQTLVDSAFNYRPSIVASAFVSGFYMAITITLFLLLVRARNWWGLCLPIGAACEGAGFILRFVSSQNPNSLALLINTQIFIICSPATFLAFNYIILGRLNLCIGSKYSPIRPTIISKVFIISDITTFLIQAAGSSSETTPAQVNIGQKIFITGVVLQLASYILFCILFVQIHLRIRKDMKLVGEEPWRKVFWLLYFSSVFIVIRCTYRVIEAAQGGQGALMTHEIYFYILDAVPLILAITIYVPFWPGNFLTPVYQPYEMTTVRSHSPQAEA